MQTRCSPRGLVKEWVRRLSSLASLPVLPKSGSGKGGPVARQAVWDNLLADSTTGKCKTREASWLESWSNQVQSKSSSFPCLDERVVKNEGVLAETWSKLCEEGRLNEAVQVMELVEQRGWITRDMFYRVLKGCIEERDLDLGRKVHALTVESGYALNAFLANHLIRMYASLGSLLEANQVFRKLPAPNVFMWASIISAYAEHGQAEQAIKLYTQMRQSTVQPNEYVFVGVLKACASAVDLTAGKLVHQDIIDLQLESNVFVGSALVDMYSKCKNLLDARTVFDSMPCRDVVAWNTMVAGYAQDGRSQEALDLYARMQEGNVKPDKVTYVSILNACGSLGVLAIQTGKQIHVNILEVGVQADVFVGSALVDMYTKCGSLDDARAVFNSLPLRDVVTWTVLIAGYVQHGLGRDALDLYARMQQEGINPANAVTFVCALKACGTVGALDTGKEIHADIQARGLEGDVIVGNTLVDMYGRCGSMEEARLAFDKMPAKNVTTWTALLNGYGQQNDCHMAIQCFEEMQRQGVEPNSATYLCLLVACSHVGLVDEGRIFFTAMVNNHGITPTLEHCNCIVDLLARSGHLDEAENVLQTMPFPPDVVGCRSLLSACKTHGDIQRGRRCFDRLVALDPQLAAGYVLMANIYEDAGRQDDVDRIEQMRRHAGAEKKPATAFIEVDNKVHEFIVGEQRDDLSSKLRSLNLQMLQDGHRPQTEVGLKPVSDQEEKDSLCGHAEKLALAYGLLNTPDGTTLLITKNLRMCNNCHSGTKVLSSIEKREIIVRDAHRVHHFKQGLCSCGDSV